MIKPIYSLLFMLFFNTSLYLPNYSNTEYFSFATNAEPETKVNEKPKANILFQSDDNGRTWQNISYGLPESLYVNRFFTQNGIVYLGSEKATLYQNPNPQKEIWTKDVITKIPGEGQINGIFHGRSCIYVSMYESGFFRKKLGANIWQPMSQNLHIKNIHHVLEMPNGNLFVSSPSGIYQSDDDGKSWKHVFTEGSVNSITTLDDVLIASGPKGLLRSTDGGKQWQYSLRDENAIYDTKIIRGQFVAIRVAGPWISPADLSPLRTLISADGGKTWKRFDKELPFNQRIYDLEEAGDYLYCSHQIGVSRSADGGKTWELMSSTAIIGDSKRFELVVCGTIIYAVVLSEGC